MKRSKTAVLMSDNNLLDEIQKIPHLEIVATYSQSFDLLTSTDTFDLVIISDRNLSADNKEIAGLYDIRNKFNSETKLIYLMSNQHDEDVNQQIMRFCTSQGLHLIPPKKGVPEIVDEIIKYCGFKKETAHQNRLIAFTGTSPNVGAHTVALNYAILLANSIEDNIAFLDLDLKGSKTHRHIRDDYSIKGFDSIIDDVRSRTLNVRGVVRNMRHIKGIQNLFILTGTDQRVRANQIEVEDIHYLLETVMNEFPITIAVVNAYWDNAATFASMKTANTRYVVTIPEVTNFIDDWDAWYRNVLFSTQTFKASQFDVIVNQSSGNFSKRDISKQMEAMVVAEIPLDKEGVRKSINSGIPLAIDNEKHPMIIAIKPLVASFLSLTNLLSVKERVKDKKTRFGFLKAMNRPS